MNRDQARQAFMECISILYNWGNTAHMLGLAASESPYEQTDEAKAYEARMKQRALELLAIAFPCMGPDRLDPRSAGHHEAWTAAERLIWKCARIEAKDYPRERGTDALELVLEMFAEARSALQKNIEALLSGSDALLVPEESAPNLGSSTHTDAAMREAQRQLAERPCTATSSPRTVPAGNSWVDADGHPLRVGQRVRIATGQEGTVVTLGGRHPDEVAVRFAGCIHDSHFEPSGLLVVHEAPPSRESSPVNPELHTVAGRQRLAELARDVLDACERPGGDHWATAEGIQRMFVRARKLAEFILEEKR